ncbi:MAG: carbohydrate kinase [Saprospiraceae bacterium]|nr:carbohydrate kinase [Saprospiraceae bacterium]
MVKVTAVFDIGRTNKKFFLFDKKLREVFREYTVIEEIRDEDGFPCDDISEIVNWVKKTLDRFINQNEFELQSVNFSAYGASMVHVDREGKPVAPLYSYLKPIPADVLDSFYSTYGDQWRLAKETASPPLAMLNSGLQPYWIKQTKPELFKAIKWSMHLPQFLSYLFTGLPVSDFTSIGCHTMLWDYTKKDYHAWVYAEKIDQILPPIVDTDTMVLKSYQGHRIKFGVGIHDSSSALIPYFIFAKEPFLLVSTGTWSISMNPFSDSPLSKKNLQNDVLKFMQIDGRPVKASRLFLGNEFKLQTNKLLLFFKKRPRYHHGVKINWKLIDRLRSNYQRKFIFETIKSSFASPGPVDLGTFRNFEEAYHQLMLELVELQVKSVEMAIGKTSLKKIYIDGGFIDNDIYVKLLADYFSGYKIQTARSALGSALGAAIVISARKLSEKSLARHYELKRQKRNKSKSVEPQKTWN